MVCLPSLKTLRLEDVKFFNNASIKRLLSSCPVLEDLLVDHGYRDDNNMRKLTVTVPSLQRLTLNITRDLDEFVINTPSLEYFRVGSKFSSFNHFLIEKMPGLWEAFVEVGYSSIESVLGSITSVERLSICLPLDSAEVVYGDGFVFNNLKHLKLCICQNYYSNVLVRLLKDSPKLQILELVQMDDHYYEYIRKVCWNQPATVPECMLSSLQIVKWSRYSGRPEERDLAIYILKNGRLLKAVTIDSVTYFVKTLDKLKELARCTRASTTCELFS